ncbi:MAG: hypothetical protein Q8934_04415 [Bacillota bacterium]|nr:hypothetical protein [Bacillota bacterium]
MNGEMSQKEKLLLMMTEIYNQLEELETVLEETFADLHETYFDDEVTKLTTIDHKMTNLEKKFEEIQFGESTEWEMNHSKKSPTLKFELGY